MGGRGRLRGRAGWARRDGRTEACALACLFLSLSVLTAFAAPAEAQLPANTRQVKELKRALVRIEGRLDEAKGRLGVLRRRLASLDEAIGVARADLRSTARGSGPATDAQFLTGIGELARAHLGRADARASEGRGKLLVTELLTRRKTKIEELESIAAANRAKTPSPSWSLGGELITYSADWESVALCESSGRWHIDAHHDGGLQFDPRTWVGFGGGALARFAHEATKKQQIAIAERTLAIQGPRAWPKCFTALPFNF